MSAETIRVSHLARVEGEGALTVRFRRGRPVEARLEIFEPPRFFEEILRGRSFLDAPDITARICGICPFAHLSAASLAMEAAAGVRVDGALRELRRIVHCGSWIESHALSVFLLHLPDFLGYPDFLRMARDHRELVETGLRLKRAGNALCAAVGGREIHPVNLRVGGFWRAPDEEDLRALLPELEWGLEAALGVVPFLARLPFPELERDWELVALHHPGEYASSEGRIVSSHGLEFEPARYDEHVLEEPVPRSNALHSVLRGRGAFLTGPLARLNLDFDQLGPAAREAARLAGVGPGLRNPFRAILARAVEVVQCLDEAVALVRRYRRPDPAHREVPRFAGAGQAAVEAPRGLLLHAYEVGGDGLVRRARIVTPTSHNLRAMEEDLLQLAPGLARLPRERATLLAEQAVRNHDPCISCATHFLDLRLEVEPGGGADGTG